MKRAAKKAVKKGAKKSAKRPKSPAKSPVAASAVPVLKAQPNGGALWAGPPAHPVAGPGRPKNEIRAKLRDVAWGKGLDFLEETLDGKVSVKLIGRCQHCGEEGEQDPKFVQTLLDRVSASVEHRLRANEQALRFGVGTQSEQVVSEDDIKAWEGHVARYLHGALTAEGWPLDRVGALLSGLDEHMKQFDPREKR